MTTIAQTTDNLRELHIVERIDELGPYCLVYTDDTAEGQEATYQSLEAAAWAIVAAEMKRGERHPLTVHGDDGEVARFDNALIRFRREWENTRRLCAAPRDKKTGRPLFVRMH